MAELDTERNFTMKKFVKILICTGLLGLLALTGCDEDTGQETGCIVYAWQSGNLEPIPPQLYVFLEPDKGIRAITWHMGFSVFDKDGNMVGAMLNDSPHPSAILSKDFSSAYLQLSYRGYTHLDWQFIGLDFTYGCPPNTNLPQIASVTRWRLEYRKEYNLYLTAGCWYYGGETVELIAPGGWTPGLLSEMIIVWDDGYDYIYIVQPEWREGQIRWRSLFAFRVNSDPHLENIPIP